MYSSRSSTTARDARDTALQVFDAVWAAQTSTLDEAFDILAPRRIGPDIVTVVRRSAAVGGERVRIVTPPYEAIARLESENGERIDIGDVAARLGVDSATARRVARAAVAALRAFDRAGDVTGKPGPFVLSAR